MDETYRINVAKTQFREGYNLGDVNQLLSVFDREGFTDMSEGRPNFYGEEAREALREHATKLFEKYFVRLDVIVIEIIVSGDTAYDYGWHEFTLTPKNGGKPMLKRDRYLDVWKKGSAGEWKISYFISNPDVREEMAGQVSHWFMSQEPDAKMHGSIS